MKKELLTIVAQAFYGNRVLTQIEYEDIDCFVLGHLTNDFPISEPIDRTIIRIPDSNCVLVYNKHQEEEALKQNERWYKEEGYIAKPLASIPELNLDIYSRCFMCRIDSNGKLIDIQNEDSEIMRKYLAG